MWMQMKLMFFNGPFPASLSLFSSFLDSNWPINTFEIFHCRCRDLNRGSLVLEWPLCQLSHNHGLEVNLFLSFHKIVLSNNNLPSDNYMRTIFGCSRINAEQLRRTFRLQQPVRSEKYVVHVVWVQWLFFIHPGFENGLLGMSSCLGKITVVKLNFILQRCWHHYAFIVSYIVYSYIKLIKSEWGAGKWNLTYIYYVTKPTLPTTDLGNTCDKVMNQRILLLLKVIFHGHLIGLGNTGKLVEIISWL